MQSPPDWRLVLDEREAKHFAKELVLGGNDGWNP